jgi:hypothetical protein
MLGFKLFDENKLIRNETLEEIISNWLNEKPYRVIQVNQSIDMHGNLLISFFYWKRRFRNQPKSSVKNHPPGDVDAPVRHRC